MKKGHFRLTCVPQKRCCLSSLFIGVWFVFPQLPPHYPPPPPPFLHFFVSVKTVKDAWLLGLSRRNDRPTTSLSGWPGAAGEQYYFNLTPHFNLLKSRKDILLSISSNKNVKFKRTDRVVFRRHLTFPSVLQWLRLHHLFKCNASVQLGTKDERSFEETGLETTNAWNRTEWIQKMNYALCLWLWNYSTCLKVSDIQCDTFCFLSDWLGGSIDWVFQGQYLPSLNINYIAITKDLEKLPPQGYNDIGVVIAKKWALLAILLAGVYFSARETVLPNSCTGTFSSIASSMFVKFNL